MAPENPYTPPAAHVMDPAIDVPDEILKKIKHAWVAGAVSGCITLVVTLVAMFGTRILGFSAWGLMDVALIFGFTFGIYKKSRACAVLMLLYFILSKILLMMESGRPTGIPWAIVFGYFFWQGISGTFAYYKHMGRSRSLAARGG